MRDFVVVVMTGKSRIPQGKWGIEKEGIIAGNEEAQVLASYN